MLVAHKLNVEYFSIVKPTTCTILEFTDYHSTCCGLSFRPSSGVQGCTHSIRYMSYGLVDCLLAGTPASKQSTNLYDIYLMLCVQPWTPDDGRKDCPKHVEWYSINSKIVHLVGFTMEIYHDARSHERQIWYRMASPLGCGVEDTKSGDNETNSEFWRAEGKEGSRNAYCLSGATAHKLKFATYPPQGAGTAQSV